MSFKPGDQEFTTQIGLTEGRPSLTQGQRGFSSRTECIFILTLLKILFWNMMHKNSLLWNLESPLNFADVGRPREECGNYYFVWKPICKTKFPHLFGIDEQEYVWLQSGGQLGAGALLNSLREERMTLRACHSQLESRFNEITRMAADLATSSAGSRGRTKSSSSFSSSSSRSVHFSLIAYCCIRRGFYLVK